MQTSSTTILDKKYLKLVIQISLTEISFCLLDTLRKKIETFGNYTIPKSTNFSEIEASIIHFMQNTSVLQGKFDEVLVLHQNNLLTFVPQAFFIEEQLASYLQYNVKVFPTDFITFDPIENYEMNNVYVPYVNINNVLLDLYGSFTYKHASSILVQKVLDWSKNNEAPQIFVHCQESNFQLIAVKNQKLVLFNTFDYQTKEDFLYYLLFTAEQLHWNPESFVLKLFGKISKESELYQIAYKYVRNVSLFIENNDLDKNIAQQDYLQNFILIHACE